MEALKVADIATRLHTALTSDLPTITCFIIRIIESIILLLTVRADNSSIVAMVTVAGHIAPGTVRTVKQSSLIPCTLNIVQQHRSQPGPIVGTVRDGAYSSGEASCSTGHQCLVEVPVAVADSAPGTVVEDLHDPLVL